MRIKVTRPDGSVVWEAVYMDGALPNLGGFGVDTDGKLWISDVSAAVIPPWKLEIVPGSGEEVSGENENV